MAFEQGLKNTDNLIEGEKKKMLDIIRMKICFKNGNVFAYSAKLCEKQPILTGRN